MCLQNQIRILEHNDIDKIKYDECIASSVNSLIYAQSFYLDNMSKGWKLLTDSNYNFVMPLTGKSKFGISYLYQPPFTQQFGVFYKAGFAIDLNDLIEVLKRKYKFFEINLNYHNTLEKEDENLIKTFGTNFILSLNQSYQNIYNNFAKDVVKNLKRTEKFRLVYRPSKDFSVSADVYISHYRERMKHLTETDYNNFRNVCTEASKRGMLICREVVNQQNQLMATIVLLTDGKRLYNIMNTTTDEGRKVEANYLLMSSVLKEFSNQQLIFDFEGSDLPGVRQFYQNFGGINQPYTMIRYNGLPWPLRLLK